MATRTSCEVRKVVAPQKLHRHSCGRVQRILVMESFAEYRSARGRHPVTCAVTQPFQARFQKFINVRDKSVPTISLSVHDTYTINPAIMTFWNFWIIEDSWVEQQHVPHALPPACSWTRWCGERRVSEIETCW